MSRQIKRAQQRQIAQRIAQSMGMPKPPPPKREVGFGLAVTNQAAVMLFWNREHVFQFAKVVRVFKILRAKFKRAWA